MRERRTAAILQFSQTRRPCTDAENGHCAPAMDSTTSSPRASGVPRRRRLSSKLRRRLVGVLVLAIGLFTTGTLYLVFAPRLQIATAEAATLADPAQIGHGEQLYNNACITCHGTNLQGVQDRGPSLIGVGAAAVYFQVSTGRMPQAREQAEGLRKAPVPAGPRHRPGPAKPGGTGRIRPGSRGWPAAPGRAGHGVDR